jgi:thiol-disulfide isomerase/thioredoxin
MWKRKEIQKMLRSLSRKKTLFAAALFLASTNPASSAEVKSSHGLKEGKPAPELSLKSFSDGKEIKLSALRGKVVLLNFWASWCAPCLAELPSIIDLWKADKGKGFEVVAVNEDEDAKQGMASVADKIKFPFPVYTDEGSKLANDLQFSSFPVSVLIDKKGIVQSVLLSEKNWNSPESKKIVDKLL